tara:strand:- start:832 stop:1377 length:546 start_codon:yes stop_codon:yes gene_type:complete
MLTYVLLLRGINVSGQKSIKMTDLSNLLLTLGFKNCRSYIQSGNVVFNSSEVQSSLLEEKVTVAINKTFGFEVPVLIIESNIFTQILENSPWRINEDSDYKNFYFVLLKNNPQVELIKSLEAEKYPNEEFSISPNCVYLKCNNGYGKAKCNNNFFEKKLKVQATTRNYLTMQKLIEMIREN